MKDFIVGLGIFVMSAGLVSADTVRFDKRNTGFSIDGGIGGVQARQIYLWTTSDNNVNEHWEEIEVDDDFYMYQKAGTNVCIDGMGGGSNRQAVHLWPCNENNRNQHWEKKPISGGFTRLKKRGVSYSLDCGSGGSRRQTCHLFRSQDSNVNQHFTITNLDDNNNGNNGDNGDNGNSGVATGQFNLNPNNDPWENFDLRFWKIDTPAGEDSSNDCDAQTTEPYEWDDLPGSRSNEFFFTHTDGGMRFIAEYGGGTTGGDCDDKSRSELREMLRGSNRNIDTTGKNGDFRNNWALGYQPNNADADESWGARGGKMSATLIVNEVTESGSEFRDQGNVVIGQIHASSDEPLRLHYRIRPGMSRGCIWASTEIRDGDDVDIDMIGDFDCTSSPSNGIALGEMFSYEIENIDEDIIVTIREGDRGSIINRLTIDLDRLDSGYDRDDEWNYFKAGAYSQNDDGDEGDRDIVTFYRLDIEH